ncbi:MAG TPA: hypothetical protein VEH06_06625 [Candidatus Bathyarchaeia archaeon]|nr:hypothetical protein [Candidatus Bathyarchaeia archaeon]
MSRVCGLTSLPDRRTFDRRLSTISADIKERDSNYDEFVCNPGLQSIFE